jgi:hypothetical protein
MTTSSRRLGLALVLSLLVLAACGSDGTNGDTGTPSPSTSPTSSTPSGSPSRPMTTLRGTVGPGVEGGCTILTAGDRVYELLGAPVKGLRPGSVTVVGYVAEGVMTFCQQGTPFRVVEVRTD